MPTVLPSKFEPLQLPAGVWRVDPTAARVGFQVKSMWGLVSVNGFFTSAEGELHVGELGGASGELIVDATSLHSGNRKRDEHLRSADFFDVDRHPTIRFVAGTITPRQDGLTVTGDLYIRATMTRLQLPVTVTVLGDDVLRLETSTSVPREKVGLTWNRGGMIRGEARLNLKLDLFRTA